LLAKEEILGCHDTARTVREGGWSRSRTSKNNVRTQWVTAWKAEECAMNPQDCTLPTLPVARFRAARSFCAA
jgi:hypothetical protein